ncbi:MAG: histidine kinase [Dermatophilaceae bacterium]
MWSAARAMWTEPAVTGPAGSIHRHDRVLAAVLLVAAAVEAFGRTDPGWRTGAVVGLGLVLAVAVLMRRARSLAAVCLGFGAFLAVDVAAVLSDTVPVVLYSGVVVLALVYSLWRWASGRDVVLGTGVIVVEFVVSTITDFSGADDALGGMGLLLFAAALGAAVRYRVMAREQFVEQVRLQERGHLARDLHDVVAHHVSAIAIQAQAGLVLARGSPDGATVESLEIIEHEAVRALGEMRTMIGVLRGHDHEPAYPPGSRVVDIERLAVTGSDSLQVDVELAGDLTDLASGVELALYRVAQEALTNARRHARLATCVEICVVGSTTHVQLTVSDDGARTTTSGSPGYGLVGMAERVSLLGGTLTAGPGSEHGWVVRAALPRAGQGT